VKEKVSEALHLVSLSFPVIFPYQSTRGTEIMPHQRVGYVFSEECLHHLTPEGHPERPDRLRALHSHLRACGLLDDLIPIPPDRATADQLLAVHTQGYIDSIRSMCAQGGGVLPDGETYTVQKSFVAAQIAAGGVLAAIDAVLAGSVQAAFCAGRPPGHHAERDRAMGFCIFNNVAVGARYAQHHHHLRNIAIIDWDVHHGNGTQHTFEADDSVLYISLHQYPLYPGTGAEAERGIGSGEGYTVNIPLPAGAGEREYLAAFDSIVVPSVQSFGPDLLILSAGFDAHRDDPLAGMKLTEQSYYAFTKRLEGVAPIVSVLEGGYNLRALSLSVESHLRALHD
jgi:acetoin utilization deacetylase AcuC-like enzyme